MKVPGFTGTPFSPCLLEKSTRSRDRCLRDRVNLPARFFGEGLTIIGDSIYQLTWRSRQGFIYDKESLRQKGSFTYLTEGWGLTDDGTQLIMSDGTEKLYFLSPTNFGITRILSVKENGSAVTMLNELEYVEGKIYCNIWQSDDIVVVDSYSGMVERRINLGELRERLSFPDRAGVLNGIAWKSSSRTFLITGKNWSEVFEIRFGFNFPLKREPKRVDSFSLLCPRSSVG